MYNKCFHHLVIVPTAQNVDIMYIKYNLQISNVFQLFRGKIYQTIKYKIMNLIMSIEWKKTGSNLGFY